MVAPPPSRRGGVWVALPISGLRVRRDLKDEATLMRVRVHRGSHEVGGSCDDVEHDGYRWRLVLDAGH